MIASAQGCDFMFYLIVPLQCCCCWETSSLLAQKGECLWKGTKRVKFAEQEKSIKALHCTVMRIIHFADTKNKRWCLTDPREDILYSTLCC